MSQCNSELLRALRDVRNTIYGLCLSGHCINRETCRNNGSVCTKQDHNNKRKIVESSGGNFSHFIHLRNAVVTNNMMLVAKQAHMFGCPTMNHKDIIQEGHLGLIKAVERFDISIGTRFSTYAYRHIRKMMLKYIKNNNLVRKKGQGHNLVSSIHRAFDKITQNVATGDMDGPVDAYMVIEEVQRTRTIRNMSAIEISIPAVKREVHNLLVDSDISTGGRPLKEEQVTEQEHSEGFYSLLNSRLEEDLLNIPIITAEAIKIRFGLGPYRSPATMAETACILGLTKQAVEQRIERFFQTKRLAWGEDILEEYI